MSQEHSQKHLIRLQKYIADCGITSRRKAEHYILEGRVTVNNEIVDTLGTKICPKTDVVSVDGEVADLRSVQKIYVLMHKPRAYITSVSDPENRPTVIDLIKEVSERIYPVGRLDYLSEGLLILTNDGDLAQQIMHPSFEVEKVYEVKVFGAITDSLLRAMRGDVLVDGVRMKPKAVRVIKQLPGKTWLEFRLNEGKNREIRKICEAHGLTVDKLKRVAIGQLTIDGIAPGKSRFVSRSYIEKMVFSQAARSQGFFSGKKTVDLKKKGPQNPIAADSEIFRKFRRESYYETVQKIKEFQRQFEWVSDASLIRTGAVLLQASRVVEYTSKKSLSSGQNYTTKEQETLVKKKTR